MRKIVIWLIVVQLAGSAFGSEVSIASPDDVKEIAHRSDRTLEKMLGETSTNEDTLGLAFNSKEFDLIQDCYVNIVNREKKGPCLKRIPGIDFTGKNAHGMTSAELYAVILYTRDGFMAMNSCLRSLMEVCTLRTIALIEAAKRGLRKLPEFQGLTIRRSRLPADILAQHIVDHKVKYESFTSALSQGEWNAHPRTKLNIFSKHARVIEDVTTDLAKEVIFLPGSTFRILKVTPGAEYEIDMVEVDSNEDAQSR